MLSSSIMFVIMASLIRYLGDDTSVYSMIFWRSFAGVLMVLPFLIMRGKNSLKVTRLGKVFNRCLFSAIGFFTSFYAFANLPLAGAQALSFTRPLFITLLAVFLLKEKVAWRRWSAIFVGFIGVLIMTNPKAGFNFASIMALVSALSFALAIVTVKDLTKDNNAFTLIFYSNFFTAICGIPFILLDPVFPSQSALLPLLIMGITGVLAQIFYVKGLSIADASLMGIIDYIRLPCAALIGLFIFNEKLETNIIIGSLIVVISTVYITIRESKIAPQKLKPLENN